MSHRSLKVPGSPSAALQTTVRTGQGCAAMLLHLVPAGTPAPPRPRSPDSATAARVAAGDEPRAGATAAAPVAARYSASEEKGRGPRREWSAIDSGAVRSSPSDAQPLACRREESLSRRDASSS